ncbi:EAL domain-containing protein [Acidaminobacter sp. JC074]|uniref:EAL domain-containing protein n=1 Tax=Acidaminobacter sp. JC074 TaxID=2530199 RepID=UPI001F0D453B|nr:EAL domain-containing protein [Acidaminobacter sp. JC074]MCH4888621.1 EAL domain-containing protein [Acidaminobacter sp. JC074]
MKKKSLLKYINSSINLKLLWMTTVCLLIYVVIVSTLNFNSIGHMKTETLDVTETELNQLVEEYYGNYAESVYVHVNGQMDNLFNELHILSSALQRVFSNRSELTEWIDAMRTSSYFRDNLDEYSNYMQNMDDEPTVVSVPSYLFKDGIIDEEVVKLIDDTRILDLLMPAFMEHGVEKLQIYFQGGQNREVFRLAPWTNLGQDTIAVYPELFNQPIWETFNPGLAGEWRERITNSDIDEITQLLRVTPPVQDGLSGDLVLTLSQPIANEGKDNFEGTISYDVSIGKITSMIEDISISETGFAFVTQSSGNVFSVNQDGLEVLGLSSDSLSTTTSDEGFNRLDRKLEDSKHEAIQNLDMNNDDELKIQTISIDGEDYMFASKKLYSYQSWLPEKSFFEESWQIGFLVPRDEVFHMYYEIEEEINSEVSVLTLNVFIITFVLAIIILFLIYKSNTIVTRELVTLSKAADAVKQKKYDVEIKVDTIDEVGVLASAFREMIAEIKTSFHQMETHNERLQAEIDERIKRDRIIDYLENFDSGTDLPNKKALLNILKELKDVKEQFVSLVVIGLDEFRKVNEAYSWTFGDKLIKAISERLRQVLPNECMLFKLSGDEFAFIFRDNKLKNLINTVEDVNQTFKEPYKIGDYEILIGSSVGISSFPFDTSEPTELFKFATNAMIHCKEVNKGRYEFYSAEMNDSARMRMIIINELRNAIENDELTLLYQPIVSVMTKEVTGMEALLRWENDTLGHVSPAVFIPLAEKTDLIISLGIWILKRALREAKRMHDEGLDHLNIAVNVSVMQFLDAGFIGEVKKAIEDCGIDAKKVTVEITEGLFINDLQTTLRVLNELRSLGISISVDDFGTGYSSLSYIKDLPLSKLKIDRSFINAIDDIMSQKLVSAIIGLAHNLNLSVVAEGVETEEQLSYIESRDCEELQGYLYSKPLGYDDFVEYVKKTVSK